MSGRKSTEKGWQRREQERGRLGTRGRQSLEEEGEDSGHLSVGTTIVKRGRRRQWTLRCRQALGCIEKGHMGAETSIVKSKKTHERWDGNHQEHDAIILGSKDQWLVWDNLNDKILNKINKTKEMLIFFLGSFYFILFYFVGDRNVKQRSWGMRKGITWGGCRGRLCLGLVV